MHDTCVWEVDWTDPQQEEADAEITVRAALQHFVEHARKEKVDKTDARVTSLNPWIPLKIGRQVLAFLRSSYPARFARLRMTGVSAEDSRGDPSRGAVFANAGAHFAQVVLLPGIVVINEGGSNHAS